MPSPTRGTAKSAARLASAEPAAWQDDPRFDLRQLFAKIAADKQVPQSIRARAVQLAGSLGVDATASIPGDPAATPAL